MTSHPKSARFSVNRPQVYDRLSAEDVLGALRRMHRIRRFEEAAEDSYIRGLSYGTMHLSIGQEATAVGACMPLSDADCITSTHRGHGHCIAKGAELKPMFAEFLGRESGYCKGRGGSMHIAEPAKGNLGANGIVGGGLPIAVGAALSAKKRRTGAVALAFFGDGANNEGAFHEALNLASIWKLPVVFVCENNQYAMSTAMARATAVANVADRASAYAIPGVIVDGNDFAAVGRGVVRGDGASAGGRRSDADRGQDLSHPRPFPFRPQPLSYARGDRGLEGARSDRALRSGDRRARPRDRGAGRGDRGRSRKGNGRSGRRGEREPMAGGRRCDARRLFARRGRASMSGRELSYAEAIREALAIALERDERVFLMGEDIGVYGGAFQVTGDLVERFGEERVMDTPISELGGAGVAVGAALTGMRPVYEFQFSDFSMLAMEQIVNQAAKLRYMLGGAVNVPVVFRMPTGSGLGGAAQHSQSIEAWYAHVPGLKVVEPSTPEDVKGMLLAAIKDPDPVIVFEHKLLYKMKGLTPEGYYETPLDRAVVRREGRDLTIVAAAIMVHRALEAADILAKERIEAEVIDLRCSEADRQGRDRGQRQEDWAASRRLRGCKDVGDWGGNLGHRRRERGLRLPRRADHAARRRRGADSL